MRHPGVSMNDEGRERRRLKRFMAGVPASFVCGSQAARGVKQLQFIQILAMNTRHFSPLKHVKQLMII